MGNKNIRKEKGKEITTNRYDIIRMHDDYYAIKSQTTNREYTVWLSDINHSKVWECNCPDRMYRRKHCKHIHAIEFLIKDKQEKRQRNKITLEPITVSNCKYCDSKNIVKDGKRHNKYGDLQKWHCKDCNHYFTFNIGFEKMKHSPKGITTAMHLYFAGESLRNTAKSLEMTGVVVSHQTIYHWIKKYVKKLQKFLGNITPQVGDTWRADEIFLKVRGKQKYLFSMMDDETRFWIAQEVADRKEGHNARGLLQKSKQVTGTRPRAFITDGLDHITLHTRKNFGK